MRAGVPGAVRREDGAFAKAGVRTRSYDVSAEQARAALAKVAEYKAHAPTFSFARRDCGQFAADVLKAARIEGFAGPGVRRPAELYRQVQRGVQAKIAPLEVWSRASCTAGGVRHVSVEGTAAARGDRVQMYFASEDRLRLGGSKLQRPIQRALKSKDWWEDELATNPFYSQRMGPLKAAGSTEYEAMRSPLHELGVETDPTIINKAIALLPIEKNSCRKKPRLPLRGK